MVKCPYCGENLEKKPTRKKKCPHCSQYMYIRQGIPYTEDQVKARDFRIRWINKLNNQGATEALFENARKSLADQFGFEPSLNDSVWRLMNSLVPKQTDSHDLFQLYILMGEFVSAEGKDPTPYIKQANGIREIETRNQLLKYKKDFEQIYKCRINIHTANDEHVCENCNENSKKQYEISDFLERLPIPRECTSNHGCRCGISISFI